MDLPAELIDPAAEFSVMPFWFWNDDLDAAEILRQIEDFERHGVRGFVIHPRVGLPRDLGWMSAKLLDFYQLAIETAARRGMKVVLYDEGMYPSGSSSGQVVAANPAFACRCLAKRELGAGTEPVLGEQENLVTVHRRADGTRVAIFDRPVDSVIRGLHYLGAGPEEETPPAADLLNPDAVAKFLELVYDRFAQRFGAHFGATVMAIFTDEPALLGRCREKGVLPGTRGIVAEVSRILGYDFTPHLAALWYDDEPDAVRHRANYRRALGLRLEETYYAQLAGWCERHGVPLTGHPEHGDDLALLRHFGIPGQDLVWRTVVPDSPSALAGAESTQGKCAASAALHGQRRRNGNECCGAYGHELTYAEMQWLARWCFVRGANLLFPHAFYYSVRGPRWDERPPDVGPNSSWWDRYREYADGCRRLSWLNTDSDLVCEVAILSGARDLPWRPAKACFERQIDFTYLEERDVRERCKTGPDGIRIAGMTYRALIVAHEMAPETAAALATFAAAGRLIAYSEAMPDAELVARIDRLVSPDVRVTPTTPAVRIRHIRKAGLEGYMVFNEASRPVAVELDFPAAENAATGPRWIFDPESAAVSPWPAGQRLALNGYELKVVLRHTK